MGSILPPGDARQGQVTPQSHECLIIEFIAICIVERSRLWQLVNGSPSSLRLPLKLQSLRWILEHNLPDNLGGRR
jgi:hypothetical protein